MKPVKLFDVCCNLDRRFPDAAIPRARLVCTQDHESFNGMQYELETANTLDAMNQPVCVPVQMDKATEAVIRHLCNKLGLDAKGVE